MNNTNNNSNLEQEKGTWGELIADILIELVICLINPFFAQTLWSLIVVPVFNAPELTYIQTFGLMWLINIVFINNRIE